MKRIYRHCIFVVVLSMLYGCSAEKVELISDIQEHDANQVVAALLSTGIEAEKVKGKKTLSVNIAKKDMALAVDVLNAKGLPNRHHSNMGEVFKKEGMVSTPLEERARYIYALSQELEYTLSQIDGVLIARVHVVLPERVAPGQPLQPPSAAILIKHLPTLDPDAVTPKVKRVVISSIPGLKGESIDDISVSFVQSTLQKPEVAWVKVAGFMLTEDSAKKMTRLIKIVIGLLIVFVIVGCAGFIFLKRRSRKKSSATNNVEQKLPPTVSSDKGVNQDEDFFTGEQIET